MKEENQDNYVALYWISGIDLQYQIINFESGEKME